MAAKTLLDLAAENPKGWGEAPAAPDLANVGSVVYRDEQGNPYDANGRRIYEMHAPQPQPSLGESLLNIAESPAKMLVGAVTEPISALQRLAENSVDENGNIAIPNPENPQNQQDVLTGILSMYGGNALNPARLMEGAAARAAPEALPAARMYHGTGVPEDFATFTPSPKGSLGPGVYLSKEADTTLPWANNGPNPRIMPVDVSGPIATYDDYLSARAAAPDQAATIQALMDQGYSGAAMDVPGKSGNMNVTNVFKPGSIRSATTGETLYSDTGRPSLMGSAIVGAEGNTQLRGYRGGIKPEHVLPPEDHRTFWGSSAPEVANTYAGLRPNGDIDKIVAPRIEEVGGRQAVAPADFNFSNPMTVDAGGAQWDRIPFENKTWATSDQLAQIARDRGHDGLILNNILDSAFAFGDHTPGNTYAALKRGTVTSPLTGETLFSDTGKPSIAGAAVAGAEAPPVQAFHATNASFDKFDPAFTNEVGFHFGDKGTANNRAYIRANGNPISYMKYRNIPVEMDIQNPAAISRDVTPNYSGLPLARQLVKDGIAPPSLIDDISGKPQAEQNAAVRDWLVSNGYDAVKYPNKFEGGGKPSYMALGTGNVKHAKTGQVLYSGAPPVVQSASDDDQPLSLADLALIAGR